MDRSKRPFDALSAEELALRAGSGDATALGPLVEQLWPEWLSLIRASRSMGALARSEDDVREVASRLLAKLKRDDCQALRLYAAWRQRNPDKGFADWMRIVCKNSVRDYVRERRSAVDTLSIDAPSRNRLFGEFERSAPFERLGLRPALTAAQTARQLLEFAERHLPTAQLEVLRSWLEGEGFEEMDRARAPGSSKKLLRAAIAALRRHFASV